MDSDAEGSVLQVANLTEFFRGALQDALHRQRIAIEPHTSHYVVNMLTLFARSEELAAGFPDDGVQRRRMAPLALLLAAALQAPTPQQREMALQRLGDVSLFIAGFFAQGFSRRLIDIDYHIAMGGQAYSSLAHSVQRGPRRTLGAVFAELAAKFQPLVDALGDIGDSARQWSQRDVLRLYEIWLKTGSARAQRLLTQLGVVPAPLHLSTH